jgi:lipid-binding SYLF domain-containing protein
MKRIFLRLSVLLLCLPLMLAGVARAGEAEDERLRSANEVLHQISEIPENAIPPELLADAYGIAVIPGVIKAGFVVGGRWGKGVIAVRQDRGWSNPAFITLAGGSIGWQIGAQSTDIILVFKTRRGVENLASGKVTLGADAAIAAGPVGRQASAATDAQLKAEIYSYSRSRGLFAGIALEGAVLQPDDDANAAAYGGHVSSWDVFENRVFSTPPAVQPFRQALAEYAPPPRR